MPRHMLMGVTGKCKKTEPAIAKYQAEVFPRVPAEGERALLRIDFQIIMQPIMLHETR